VIRLAVKIRLRRVGAKKQPSYRVVVADARAPRDGAFIETIGHYNPLTDPETVKLDAEKARQWLERGAQPTEAVARLLWKAGLIERPAEAQPGLEKAVGGESASTPEE
jgi:small subunit ribosomal protein S16